jgi:ribosomal protein L37AE/L43A
MVSPKPVLGYNAGIDPFPADEPVWRGERMKEETFEGTCTRCDLKTTHRFDRFGVLRCEICQQSMPSRAAFCHQCGRDTLHCEYWGNWTCLTCGQVKGREQRSG